ncbi:hypothetical protein [Ekhidna lutea]|uniref:hypothetical protein n=1 Tax=Ekhidna lutea TaxID=447679 RepID=UPI000B76D956|nr:hypothetical protein [Ekhidna lutea]
MNRIIVILLFVSVFGCSDFDDEWKREPYESVHFEKLVVVGLSHELQNRIFYEQEAVSELNKSGFYAIEGIEIFPQEIMS